MLKVAGPIRCAVLALTIVAGAGHMMHAEAARSFNRILQSWAGADEP